MLTCLHEKTLFVPHSFTIIVNVQYMTSIVLSPSVLQPTVASLHSAPVGLPPNLLKSDIKFKGNSLGFHGKGGKPLYEGFSPYLVRYSVFLVHDCVLIST